MNPQLLPPRLRVPAEPHPTAVTLEKWLRQPYIPPRWRLTVALLLVGAAFAAVVLPAWVVRAQGRAVMLGTAAKPGTPALPDTFLDDLDPDAPRALHVVVDTPYEIWTGAPSYVHVVAYRPGFAPASGATVYVDGRAVGVTDAAGSLAFRQEFGGGDDTGGDHTLVVVHGDVRKRPFVGSVSYGANRRTSSFEQAQLYVYTDRGVYQPGETIHIRSIAWRLRGDYTPIDKEPIELTILSSAGRVLTGARLWTDRFGVASLDIPVPTSAPADRYTLSVQFGESVETSELRIERFEPPSINIRHDLPRFATFDQETLSFNVELESFTGQSLDAGSLRARLLVGDDAIAVRDVPIRGARSYPFTFDKAAFGQVKRRLDDRGTFRVELLATDGAGRIDVHRRDLVLARNPYTVVVEQDKDEYARGEVAKISVKVVDLDDRPVRGKRIRLVDVETNRSRTDRTGATGIALFDVPARGEYTDYDAYIEGVDSPVGTASISVFGDKAMVSKIRVPLVQERRMVPIEVRVANGFVPVESWVHGDVVDSSGALVHAFRLPLIVDRGGWVARGKFEAPTWGTMLVTLFSAAYRTGGSPRTAGLMVEGQQLTVVPDKALTVTLGAPGKPVRPGEQVSVSVDVKDARGERRPTALGIAVVDSAVISMLDPLEVPPGDRYYNPELKVLSTTGSKILTWPVVSRNWGGSDIDIALPPFEFQEGAEPSSRRMPMAKMAMGSIGTKGSGGGMDSLLGAASGGGGVSYGSSAGYGVGAGSLSGRAASPDDKPANRRQAGRPAEPAPKIVIRADFRETAFWEPGQVTEDGQSTFAFKVPDAIGRQTLSVVASDARGGIGTGRAEVTVTQPLFVRSDLPAELIADQRVGVSATVRNLGATAATVTVTLTSDQLDVQDGPTEPVRVGPGGATAVRFSVKPKGPGHLKYRLEARSERLVDIVDTEVFVRPEGEPTVEVAAGTVTRKAPWSARVRARPGEEVALHLTFPAASGLLEAILADGITEGGAWAESPGTMAATAAHLLRVLDRQGALTDLRLRQLREVITYDLFMIGLNRTADGGFVYKRTGRSSPYLTARALQGLTAAREADFLVPTAVLTRAADTLFDAIEKDGLVRNDDIAWWEGATKARRTALTAELFRTLAEAGPDAVVASRRPELNRLAGAMIEQLATSDDALTVSQAALGLMAWNAKFGGTAKLEPSRVIARLQTLRRQGHFEPSWFNAEGGILETTAACLELAQHLDPTAAQPLIGESLHVLLGARAGLGRWHNGAGTAAAIRALATLPMLTEDTSASLIVEVDGQAVLSQAIGPWNSYESTLSLATIDLNPYLTPGEHDVKVTYDGTLQPAVRLETTRWVAR